ncbi:hypothetical protein QT979_08560 [Microcoleus sp. w2-18bC1]|uniref:hypothetical protein n=1 Tax=unclassified Microcoleus TaxID=2642155 RepID=UPI002FD149BF
MVSAQLSLFDATASETGSFYKPGDWVKIKKIPAIAKHVRCGHLYKIHAVDPTDGRLQFWNPFSAQWDFLLPAEVKLAIAPTDKIDSITPVEVVVIESNLPHCETDTITGVDAVIESNPPLENDSITDPISIYKPGGTARSGEYYRLSYRADGRVRHQHIRGGNTDSPIAQAKVQEVRSLLAAGVSPKEVAAMLKN